MICTDKDAARWDHERDLRKHEPRLSDLLPSQISALSALLGYSSELCRQGLLPYEVERSMRLRVAETRAVFGFPLPGEEA